MEYLALHTGAPKVNWEDDTSCIYVAEAKDLILDFNTLTFLSAFYKKNLTMVSLFQHMGRLVQCRKICAPNYMQVQLSVGVLNG